MNSTLSAEWEELEKKVVHVDALWRSFCYLSESVAIVLEILRPSASGPRIFETSEEDLSEPAPQSPESPLTPALKN